MYSEGNTGAKNPPLVLRVELVKEVSALLSVCAALERSDPICAEATEAQKVVTNKRRIK